jgi:hypothetical protein
MCSVKLTNSGENNFATTATNATAGNKAKETGKDEDLHFAKWKMAKSSFQAMRMKVKFTAG